LRKEGRFSEKYHEDCVFTVEQFKAWQAKHLPADAAFLYELSGGEPSCSVDYVESVLATLNGKFQIQTHGFGGNSFINMLMKYKDKVDRIGFSYHRKALESLRQKDAAVSSRQARFLDDARFMDNVVKARDAGFQVYVKELLFPQFKEEILKNKKRVEQLGIEFRIQDFKPINGRDRAPYYSQDDLALVHPEYYHTGDRCACRVGYKNVIVRGFDYFAGDVIACWQDPKPVGSIIDDWYNPDYTVNKELTGKLRVDVGSKPKTVENTLNSIVTVNPATSPKIGGTMSTTEEVIRVLTSEIDIYAQQLNLIEAKFKQYELDRNNLAQQGAKISGFIEGARELINRLQNTAATANRSVPPAETPPQATA
jgi:hypothetical protein